MTKSFELVMIFGIIGILICFMMLCGYPELIGLAILAVFVMVITCLGDVIDNEVRP